MASALGAVTTAKFKEGQKGWLSALTGVCSGWDESDVKPVEEGLDLQRTRSSASASSGAGVHSC